MILLDTDVLSALMRPRPDPAVVDWLDRQPTRDVFTTAINVFELRYGIAQLPSRARCRQLQTAFEAIFAKELLGHVVGFDREAAEAAAVLLARRRSEGRPTGQQDGMIAGIAIARRATVATHNVRHFADAGVPVINPWTATA